MREDRILDSLKKTVESAPIDILDEIKANQPPKMTEHDDITRQGSHRTSSRGKLMVPFGIIAAVFMGLFMNWQVMYVWADSQVYLDVNPSIEMTTNRKEQVIGLKGLNADGAALVEGLEFKGRPITEVTESVLDRMVEASYITEQEKYMLLSVFNKDSSTADRQKQELDAFIHEYLNNREITPIVLNINLAGAEVEDAADDLDISAGVRQLVRQMREQDPSLDPARLMNMTLHDLVELTKGKGIDLTRVTESQDFEVIEEDFARDGWIDREEAMQIALERVGGGTIEDYDFDDGSYEFEIVFAGQEYELEINAYTGEITDFQSDMDDGSDDDGDHDDDDDDDENRTIPGGSRDDDDDTDGHTVPAGSRNDDDDDDDDDDNDDDD